MTSLAAHCLLEAARTRRPCPPVRELIGADDVAAAYAVQREVAAVRTRTAKVVGHKIGLTSAAVQRQLGVDQPDFGVLFDDMDVTGVDPVPMGGLLQPRIEAEIAFLLAADLTGEITAAAVRAAVGAMAPALEIVDSRIAGWDISIADTIADNASSGLFVLGRDRVRLDALEPVTVGMELSVDGAVVSKGSGAACPGDPLAALAVPLPDVAVMRRQVQAQLAFMDAATDRHHCRGTKIIPFSLKNVDEVLDDLDLNISRRVRASHWLNPVDPAAYRGVTPAMIARLREREQMLEDA